MENRYVDINKLINNTKCLDEELNLLKKYYPVGYIFEHSSKYNDYNATVKILEHYLYNNLYYKIHIQVISGIINPSYLDFYDGRIMIDSSSISPNKVENRNLIIDNILND